ncbi:DUF308 domain-containing protein [Paenibacillus arenilitoris]|uniref:DUF308 domain-containing protein n=1 Tax=Paenibacillus arenilitoris TaxID=2772299 RepID=A0A927H5I3_9BACL|nr:DUF308 domain-containing protein [Paenibacillus arenilitoris]MBD2869506.1 DUF308 domain-containing protein [Paenibacillus arenilitoris]
MGKYEDDYKALLDERDRRERGRRSVAGGTNDLDNVNEEMGADFAVGSPVANVDRTEDRHVERAERADTETGGNTLGWVSLVFAVVSWFIWPVLLGATAAVLGYIAYRQGSRGLGGWAMALGIIALALNVIIVPLYYAIT